MSSGSRADVGLAWALLAVALSPTLLRVARGWSTPNAEHGPVIVAACAWLVWRSRDRLRSVASLPRPWISGAALAILLWVGNAAALEPHVTIAGPAALLAVAAHVVARHGVGALRVVWFPIVFGLFALPAPGPTVFELSVRLKLLATQLSGGLLDALGIAVVRVGTTLHVLGATIVVDDGCSGLRGLVAIVAFGAFLAHESHDRRRGAAALVVAIPAAVVANVLRIVVIILLAARGHTAVLEGAAHEATGLAVYALALGAVLATSGRIRRRDEEQIVVEPVAPAPAATPLSSRDRAWLLGVVTLFAALAIRPAPGPSSVAKRLPERLARFDGAPMALAPIVFEALGDDVAGRRYVVDDPNRPVDLVVIHCADDPWRAYHPPDSCFLIGGWEIAEASEGTLAGGTPARRRLFRRGEEAELVYYWVRVGSRPAPDERSLRVALFRGRFLGQGTGATLIRLSTSAGDLAAAERRVAIFAASAVTPLETALGTVDSQH